MGSQLSVVLQLVLCAVIFLKLQCNLNATCSQSVSHNVTRKTTFFNALFKVRNE